MSENRSTRLEYRQSVRDYLRATGELMELPDLSLEEIEAIEETSKRLSILIGQADEK